MNAWEKDAPSALLETVRREFPKLYPYPEIVEIRLLKLSENLTFTVRSAGRKAVLRVSRPFYHPEEELLAELQWMDMIRKSGAVPIPEVYAGTDGGLLQSFVSERSGIRYFCSLFSFLPGKTVRQLHGRELLEKTARIGSIAASLHLLAQETPAMNRLKRFSWDWEHLLGKNARWGSWRDYPGLTREDFSLFRRASDEIRGRLASYGKGPSRYGLIHADLHLSNVILDGEKLHVIDFDDCGYGWFLYDLGCSLVEYDDGLPELARAWLEGYRTMRRLTAEDLDEAPAFLLLRRMVRLAWLSSRIGSDTARSVGPGYLERTRRLALEFLRNGGACLQIK